MSRATEHEMAAARKVAEAVTEFLIAWEEGRRERTPAPPNPPAEVKVIEPPPSPPRPSATATAQHPTTSPALLVDVKELARLLGCATRSVYKMRAAGQLPQPRRLGRMLRWSLDDVRSWIEDGCKPPKGER